MKILLLQFRPDPVVADHEFDLIVKYSDEPASSFVRVNAPNDGALDSLESFDALLIGGSGDYLISRGDIPDVIARVGELVRDARAKRIPTLGICFGAQIMTQALGGEVTCDVARQETGTFEVTQTPAGEQDPLFSQLSKKFDAQFGHKDHLTVLPPGAIHLASTERSAHTAFTFPNEPLYAVLFHPELDPDAMVFRLERYGREYNVSPDVLREIASRLRPTPQASETIRFFLNTIVRQGNGSG